ncbi:MAG: VWA domain-containing protein [Marinagarivorans sp.]|nr:VWA domain-containing protein [Marinagarivorans sp.]
MFELATPWLLLALPLPVLVYFLVPKASVEQTALKVPFYQTLHQMAGGRRHSAQHSMLQRALAVALWLLVVFAAARPQWVGEPIPLQNEGRDLLLAVDLSGSMETQDMLYRGRNLPRIDVVKAVIGEFVEQRKGDRLGLILFGDNAYLQAPLTFDLKTVKQLMDEAQLGFAGRKTAIGDAVALGIKRLQARPESARVLILLTDGANTAGEIQPRQAADLAAIAGVKIYTIGVASDQEIDTGMGFFSRSTQKGSDDLDEGALKYIAEKTNGQYFRARDMDDLSGIYATLNKIETIRQDERVFRPIQSLFHWPLGLALGMSFLLTLLRLGFISLPAARTGPAIKGDK